MNSSAIGAQGEQIAAEWLERRTYLILQRNWKTRWCEIDIIASRGDVLFFVEVKYRKSSAFGSGLEYITAKKLQQMHFAAELWIQTHKYQGACQLAALAVDGATLDVEFIDDL